MGNAIEMRNEELDWKIYHVIAQNPVKLPELIRIMEEPDDLIIESVNRLLASHLIVRQGEHLRVTSIQELLIHCQLKYSKDSPIYLDGGVIKVRPNPKEDR